MNLGRMSVRRTYPANPEFFAKVADRLVETFPINRINVESNEQRIRVLHDGIVHEIEIRALTRR